MQRMIATLVAAMMAVSAAPAFAAGDAAAGKDKSGVCAACHGASGISNNDIWPNLSGQKAGYLVKQLKAYRDLTRKDPSMDAMVKGLSDQDIENLAAYYSQLGTK